MKRVSIGLFQGDLIRFDKLFMRRSCNILPTLRVTRHLCRSLTIEIFSDHIIVFFLWRHLGKPALWRAKKTRLWSDAASLARRLIRSWSFCHIRVSICGKHFSRLLHNFKTIYKYKHMEKTDLWKHCLFLHRAGFRRMTSHFQSYMKKSVQIKKACLISILLLNL